MDQYIEQIKSNPVAFLHFMKDNGYPVVHESNIFFRDIQFALVKFLEEKTGKKIGYFQKIEPLAIDVCIACVNAGLLKKVSAQAFVVNCKEFMLPRPEPAPAAAPKPAAAEAPVA